MSFTLPTLSYIQQEHAMYKVWLLWHVFAKTETYVVKYPDTHSQHLHKWHYSKSSIWIGQLRYLTVLLMPFFATSIHLPSNYILHLFFSPILIWFLNIRTYTQSLSNNVQWPGYTYGSVAFAFTFPGDYFCTYNLYSDGTIATTTTFTVKNSTLWN